MRTDPGSRAIHTGAFPIQRSEAPVMDISKQALNDVRHLRKGLIREEEQVSYWRRVVQARADLLRRHADERRVRVDDLAEILADSQSSHRRIAALGLTLNPTLPALPNIVELWTRSSPESDEDREQLLADLDEAESALSENRHELHSRIDATTAELISRYRENPGLALTAVSESLPHITTR